MTNQSLQLYMALPVGNLDAYIRSVNHFPMLTLEEEQSLATQFRETGDLEAARKLVMAHLRFVVKVAMGYRGYGLSVEDLIQEGNIGLMKAVKRFDPAVGVRLVSFAVHWIKAEIHEFIIKNWRIVKIATTKAQRKLFFNLRSAKKRLGWLTHEEVCSVAKDLGVKPEEVLHMEARLNSYDAAFDGYPDDDSDSVRFAPADYLESPGADPAHLAQNADWMDQGKESLYNALESLDQRSRDILSARRLQEGKKTLHDLAREYNVSAERIRQIENEAIKKLQSAMRTSS
jgi:RNA polymerase sigma-32 factor